MTVRPSGVNEMLSARRLGTRIFRTCGRCYGESSPGGAGSYNAQVGTEAARQDTVVLDRGLGFEVAVDREVEKNFVERLP